MRPHRTAWQRVGAAIAGGLVVLGAMFGVRAASSAFVTATAAARPPASAPSPHKPHPAAAASADAGGTPSGQASDARVSLGRTLFFDPRLSVPEGTSCASCHDPKRAFAGNHGSTNGVALGSRPNHFAKRNTPSALYLRFVRKFHLHWEEDAPLVGAYAGFFWDGRVDSLVDLVKQPLLNPDEMNGGDAGASPRPSRARMPPDFRREFGSVLDDPDPNAVSKLSATR